MAHWIIEDKGFGGWYYRCSNCRESWNDLFHDIGLWNKCPNCGEEIDEDATEYIEKTEKPNFDKLKGFLSEHLTPKLTGRTLSDMDENIHKLEIVSNMTIEELIKKFAAGWTLTPPETVMGSMKEITFEESKYAEPLRIIKSQLEDGYIDLGLHDEDELNIIREAIKLYEKEMGVKS